MNNWQDAHTFQDHANVRKHVNGRHCQAGTVRFFSFDNSAVVASAYVSPGSLTVLPQIFFSVSLL
jgi:hypothetical protein